MSLTLKEWQQHFASLSQAKRDTLYTALVILEDDQTLKKHFDWTDIFTLKHLINNVDLEVQRKKEEAINK